MSSLVTVLTVLLVVIVLSILLILRGLLWRPKSSRTSNTNVPRPVAPSPARPLPPLPRPDPHSPYERVPTLLTPAERDFYAALRAAAPSELQIFAQVSLAGLVQVKRHARQDKSHWWRIQAKRLDFVLVDVATLAPRLVVELDDASHDREDRRERDAFLDEVLAGAGIPILHVRCQRRYDVQALAGQLATAMGIPAPVSPVAPARSLSSDGLWRPIPVARPLDAVPLPERTVTAVDATVSAMTITSEANAPARRLCGQCQAELREGAKFCSQCGVVFGA